MIEKKIGVFTSGGDAQGMNAAIRAVVRTAISKGHKVFAIYEGYEGMVCGGDLIREIKWATVSRIIHKGGTMIGTARSEEFRTRDGRKRAAKNLLVHGIDSLVAIGGDGTLTGANIFMQEWPDLTRELVESGEISPELAAEHQHLGLVGLVGSIDNDMSGTDMTIGADTALHRITDAVDALASTAASHQRAFVVNVMGRNCGYLALMSALATGADWVLIPEYPPSMDDWERVMCERLKEGRKAGRRDTIVIVAEGAHDRHGKPITGEYVREVLENFMEEDVRITVLGHVQRGGSPSAFDRNLGTLMGHAAVETLLSSKPEDEPQIIVFKGNRVSTMPLMEAVRQTKAVAEAIDELDFEKAINLRSSSFREAFRVFRTFTRVFPHTPEPNQNRCRIAVLHADGPAAGMNTAVRAIVRLIVDKGHIALGVRNGFEGLIEDDLYEMDWLSVNGWATMGGAELGTRYLVPKSKDLYAIARTIEKNSIDALVIVGGWAGYQSSFMMLTERNNYPAFNIPIVLIPASINNNLPGSELSIGADSALNNIVQAVDKIKQSAVATRRVFVVEVMGRYTGYLALMSGMATGAERVYLHEEGITLRDLQADVVRLSNGFKRGKRLGLVIRNEMANPVYNTGFICSLFEEEGSDVFDVRQAILGHLQQGGDPSPFDRIIATRLANRAVDYIIEKVVTDSTDCAFLGLVGSKMEFHPLEDFQRMVDPDFQRPKTQWWLDLREIAKVLAKPNPETPET